MSDKLSNIIAEKISSNQNEMVVIQYGIHQLLATIVNFLTIYMWDFVGRGRTMCNSFCRNIYSSSICRRISCKYRI